MRSSGGRSISGNFMRRFYRYSPFWEVMYHVEKTLRKECTAADAGLCGVFGDADPVRDSHVFLSSAGIFRGDKGSHEIMVHDAVYCCIYQPYHCTDPGQACELYHRIHLQEKEPGVWYLHDAGD